MKLKPILMLLALLPFLAQAQTTNEVAVEHFAARFACQPPATVSNILFSESTWLDYSCQMRFTCPDPKQIQTFADTLGMKPSAELRSRLASSSGPSWWYPSTSKQATSIKFWHDLSTNELIEAYANTQDVREVRLLWYDRRDNRVYYKQLGKIGK